MKNKVTLKKYLFLSLGISLLFIIILVVLNLKAYYIYNQNLNYKLAEIVTAIKKEYPHLEEAEIIKILNSNSIDSKLFNKYNVDLENDYLILKNKEVAQKYLFLNIGLLTVAFLTLIFIYLRYNTKKDHELAKITKYIEALNKKDYSLDLNDLSEDELSILKNEIYKTTIMLKEAAENSLKDKVELKTSLEDISHQLKTPLTSILIMIDNLLEDPNMDLKTKEEFLYDIKREITKINFFIATILKLSKFDACTIKFSKTSISISDLIKETITNVSSLCDLKNIKINIKGSPNIILNCDSKWEVEALTNILKNSIDHSFMNGKIDITYTQNKIYTEITITDYGEGISKKDLPHIFKRFYKGQKSSAESVGIGLALAKTIIEKDNGSISVDSTVNKTIFTIKYFS